MSWPIERAPEPSSHEGRCYDHTGETERLVYACVFSAEFASMTRGEILSNLEAARLRATDKASAALAALRETRRLEGPQD